MSFSPSGTVFPGGEGEGDAGGGGGVGEGEGRADQRLTSLLPRSEVNRKVIGRKALRYRQTATKQHNIETFQYDSQ